jgi:hypothetical protein
VDGCSFTSDFRVLNLSSFDIVVDMDWLEDHSPMQVDWRNKWLTIPYQGQSKVLHGIAPDSPDQLLLTVTAVEPEQDPTAVQVSVPTAIQHVLDEFSDLFQAPSSLPPSRACDHEIPLVRGAQPVFIRPYRYPPKLKDEIERQVQEMLSQGLIQHSSSSFSSPVLLVKKGWHLPVLCRFQAPQRLDSQIQISSPCL